MSEQYKGFPDGAVVKNLPATWKTQVPSLGWERSSGGGIGNPLQYSCLKNSMDREAWLATGYSPCGCKELDTTVQAYTHELGN